MCIMCVSKDFRASTLSFLLIINKSKWVDFNMNKWLEILLKNHGSYFFLLFQHGYMYTMTIEDFFGFLPVGFKDFCMVWFSLDLK